MVEPDVCASLGEQKQRLRQQRAGIVIRNKLPNEQITIVFIELPLLCSEDIIVQSKAEKHKGNT